MTSETPSQPTESTREALGLTQELRLATTMTGGVSLAVWMAGVAREINLLAQASQWRTACPEKIQPPDAPSVASRELYKKLLDLLDIVVDVDILSGTSAGGINAALLASSRVTGSDLGKLRDLWLDLGALTDLLRDPTDKNAPSLLYGDERMFAVLAKELPALPPGPFRPDTPPRTTLYVTTTLLTGETSQFTDSFGTLVQDVDRRGVFTFTETDLAEEKTAAALALAARSSASFPVAFEPSFVPFRDKVPEKGKVPTRPAMCAYANITRPHWVADGGLLDNQPIDVLLQRIFDSRAERPVRRVLLFVVPSSGPAPDVAKEAPPDDVNEPLGLVDGLLRDLAAVTTQSISADLRAIRTHQDRMEARTDTRLRLAELARMLRPERLLTTLLLSDYTTREATKQADALSSALLRQLSTWPPESSLPSNSISKSVPKNWEKRLAVGGDAEKVCRRGITESILGRWPSESLPESPTQLAAYGRPAYDLAKGCVLAIAQAAYELAGSKEDVEESKEDIVEVAELIAGIYAAFQPTEPPPDLRALVDTLCARVDVRAGSLEDAAAQLAQDYLAQSQVTEQAWENLGEVLVSNYATLRGLADNASSASDTQSNSLREKNFVAADQLGKYLDYLEPGDNPHSVAMNLFDLAATQRAMLPAEADIEQSLELVQVSADTRSLFAPNFQTAQQKLTGMQFHHFGAFYKRSWRANDWMWGRLDGAGWLVHVLLDPRRVRWIVQPHAKKPEDGDKETQPGAEWFLEKLIDLGVPVFPESGFPLPGGPDGPSEPLTKEKLLKELKFLDNPSLSMPPSLPLTSLWVARAWQQLVLDEELDGLAKTVIDPQPGKTPDWSPTSSRSWAEKVLDAKEDAKYALLNENPVAQETFFTDKGSPLMAHTITKAAATASAAAGSVRQLPGVLKPPLITLQTLALGGYRVVSLNKGVARSSITFGAALLVLGIALAIQSVAVLGVTGLALAGIGAYLIVLGTWQASTRLLFALLSATLVGAVLALTCHAVREWLFGTEKNPGLVGAHVHWLGTQWWHPLIVIGAIALAIIVVAAAKPSRRTRTRPPSSTFAGALLLGIGVAGVVRCIARGMPDKIVFGGSLSVALIGGCLFVLGIRPYVSWTRIRGYLSKTRIRQYLSWKRTRQYLSWLLLALLSVILVSAVLSLAVRCVREWLIGTGKDNPGLVGTPVYWLGTQGWHPLAGVIVLAAIALAVALAVIPAAKLGRRQHKADRTSSAANRTAMRVQP